MEKSRETHQAEHERHAFDRAAWLDEVDRWRAAGRRALRARPRLEALVRGVEARLLAHAKAICDEQRDSADRPIASGPACRTEAEHAAVIERRTHHLRLAAQHRALGARLGRIVRAAEEAQLARETGPLEWSEDDAACRSWADPALYGVVG